MNGASSLVRTLSNSGIDVCFSNPGTSEMHFVSALDQVGGIRCILGLFEGVVTGAADGYARMKDKPAVTLLHLGPGLGNGLANIHNARKAKTPMVNIVGEHAQWHIEHNAPLTADIEGIARPVSDWVRTSASSTTVARDAAEAVAVANQRPGRIATLVLPANTAWQDADQAAASITPAAAPEADSERILSIAKALHNPSNTALLLGGLCSREETLELAGKIAAKTGIDLLTETSNARLQRGAGRVAVKAIPYAVDRALETLQPYTRIITVNAKPPIAFFAYPDKPSKLYREDAEILCLADEYENGKTALQALCDALDANVQQPVLQAHTRPETPADGSLNPDNIAVLLAKHLPEHAIVIDESITTGRAFQSATAAAPPHDWLQLCGGSIGDGFPLSTGAAIACPDRKVIDLQSDGSGMYTLQALWTQARENLDITTVVFANQSYEILKHELRNVKANSGHIATDMMELDRPELDWVLMANGMGVEAKRVDTVKQLSGALDHALKQSGPYLIEARF